MTKVKKRERRFDQIVFFIDEEQEVSVAIMKI